MKYLPLIWAGIWRKPVRSALVLLQVALVFALFGVLQGMKSGVEQSVANTRADLLFVAPAVFGAAPLPMADLARIQSFPGVKSVTYADGLVTTYQRPTQAVFALALEPTDLWLTLIPEIFSVGPRDLQSLRQTRDGALVTADTAKKYGWHIGDRVPLTSSVLHANGSATWQFEIVGTFTDHEFGEGSVIVCNYAYLDEARALNKGTVRNFYVLASDPHHAAALSDAIDHSFANSSDATRTSSFRELAQQQMRSIGNLNFAIRAIVSAALLALLFSTSTMMMQTIRERTAEFAVLKTLGFADRVVFTLVAAEGVLVCLVGALIGLGLAATLFPYAAKFVAGLSMPLIVVWAGLGGAILIALISTALPAARAARLEVADALAGH